MLKTDETREEIELQGRLDERDDIVLYLRTMSKHMIVTIKTHPWYTRYAIRAGAAAISMAAEHIAKRHLRQGL